MTTPRAIALVGLRCVGKSTVGRLLARELGLGFVDLDDCVRFAFESDCCGAHGPSLGDWIRTHGWPAFRALESAELERLLADGAPRVIATGGGVVEHGPNRRRLAAGARVAWLREDLEVLARRLEDAAGERPALTGLEPRAELRRIADLREPLYADVAELVIDVAGRRADAVARELAARLRGTPGPG